MTIKHLLAYGILISASTALSVHADSVHAEDTAPEQQITVTGSASVHAVPDLIRLSFQINEKGPLLTKMKALVDQKTSRLLNDLLEQGIAEADIQSYRLQVHPNYEYDGQRQEQKGFTLSRQIDVVLRQPDQFDQVIDNALSRGVTQVSNIDYQLSNPEQLYQRALLRAFAQAREKATQIAQQADANLGLASNIEELTGGQHAAPIQAEMRIQQSPSLPGQQSVEATIRVTFGLSQK
ncbi:MAG: SIMPL domain-containing protein [Idiomarina sp.]